MIKYSTGLANFLMQHGSFKRAFEGGELQVRTGSQPISANKAPTGTLLIRYTLNSGTRTAEVLPQASVTLTGGSSGSVDSITIDGFEILGESVPYNTSLAQTASDVAEQINKFPAKGFTEVTAETSDTKIIITAVPCSGDISGTVAVSTTTLTYTAVDLGTETAGVDSVNGLKFGVAEDGILSKDGIWSGVAIATGTGGWFRLVGSVADSESDSTTDIRMDGNVGVSGADLDLPTTNYVAGRTYTIDEADFTLPLTAS